MNGQLRIDQMYAFVIVDDDDTEGIPAFMTQNGMMMPMVGADMERIDQLRPMAEQMAKAHEKKITLIRFSVREEVEVFNDTDDDPPTV